VASFFNLTVRSTTETLAVGTLKAIPVNFPLSYGRTNPTALAAPVEDGITFGPLALPPLQSLAEVPSTVTLEAVVAWTVVISPSSIPNSSSMSLLNGARQLVVQEALETTYMDES